MYPQPTPNQLSSISSKSLFGNIPFKWNNLGKVNVLSGDCGSGKTTILEAIYETLTFGSLGRHPHGRINDLSLTFNDNTTDMKIYGSDSLQLVNEDYHTIDLKYLLNTVHGNINQDSLNLFEEKINNLFKVSGKTLDVNEWKSNSSLVFDTLSGNKISLPDLSSGEQHLLRLYLTAMVFDYESKEGILLLDNPDVYLHFYWQKTLISDLLDLNPNLQIFVATHSPGIIVSGWEDRVQTIEQITQNV
jgi:predicted ATP-binding protein involved in virulence